MTNYFTILLFTTLVISACTKQGVPMTNEIASSRESSQLAPDHAAGVSTNSEGNVIMLHTAIIDGRMAFVGSGGVIDGIVNPDLTVQTGTTVRVTVVNDDGMLHDLAIPDLGVKTSTISGKGAVTELSLTPSIGQEGTYAYFCTVSGHRQAGMEGKLLVLPELQSASSLGN